MTPQRKRYAIGIITASVLLIFAVGLVTCQQLAPPQPPATPAEEEAAAVTETDTPAPAEAPASDSAGTYRRAREAMVESQIAARDVSDQVVLEAMMAVPRHEFVPAEHRDQAYADHPLPIGHGQTISQPYIVALMTELADVQPGERVLEIGTGSGYQAAVLAQLTDEVYSIEIVPPLAERAQTAFDRAGYEEIVAKQDDGYWGWEEYAPFDAIVVTAAPDHVPQPLVNQLADGGRMVIPVGPPGGYQSLWVLERDGEEVTRYNWGGVRFVPFTRAEE